MNWSKIDRDGSGEWFFAKDASDALRWAKNHARAKIDPNAAAIDPLQLDDRNIYPVIVGSEVVAVMIDARSLAPQPSEWPELLGFDRYQAAK